MSKSELKYAAHKMEFLALKWAVTEVFHENSYGSKFDVYTDNNPLTYDLFLAKLDVAGHRQVASLANYYFSMHHKTSKSNNEVDALSRIQQDEAILA